MPPVTRPTSTRSAELDPTIETQVVWMKYKNLIIVAVLAVLIGAAAFGAYTFYTNRRDDAAAVQLAHANDIAAYQKVISDYGNTPAGATAYLFLAAEQRKAQQFADANATLGKFISAHPKHELLTSAEMAMAANLESLGRTDDAQLLFRRIAAEHPRDFNAPLALLAQVPLLKAKGQIDEARQVCETVMTQYRDSEATAEASRYLRVLKPRAVENTPAPQASGSVSPAPKP